ncbi:hypothetical protein DNTS_034386 [Danionella cerebrum]|uniref:Peptidase A2 domain-containing protein n=1 Tax=Danionella cerebrum TaxID=2873325 RepID=A0A553Q180_9TELE|nr:hypothetical protein DNTS_034386 [Danionella translucida]
MTRDSFFTLPKQGGETNVINASHDISVTVWIGQKPYKALIDSGSDQTLVRPECFPGNPNFNPQLVKIRCIHGDEREYPCADLNLEIAGQTYCLNVCVAESAPYPVILGKDVPVLVDLMQTYPQNAFVVTRSQQKVLPDLTFENFDFPVPRADKPRKSCQDKRRSKVRGTKLVDALTPPVLDETEILPRDLKSLQQADLSLKVLFDKATSPDALEAAVLQRITITHGSSVDLFTEHRALSRVLFATLMSSSSRYPHSDISWKRSIIFTIASLVRHGDELYLSFCGAQIAEKEERKQREREEQRKRDLKLEGEQEKYTYWGRGGGGAPLKDVSGNLITDLKAHLRKPNACETVARGEARPASRKKESASFSPAPPSTYGRGNVFEEGLTSHQRNQDQRHRDFLKLQIEENKRRQEEEREKVRMEEEREERRITREREIMKKEYEAELEKRRRKDRETRR